MSGILVGGSEGRVVAERDHTGPQGLRRSQALLGSLEKSAIPNNTSSPKMFKEQCKHKG